MNIYDYKQFWWSLIVYAVYILIWNQHVNWAGLLCSLKRLIFQLVRKRTIYVYLINVIAQLCNISLTKETRKVKEKG